MTNSTPKQEPPYGLRMPPDLKARVKAAADMNNRSMNAEIIAALEERYPARNLDKLREAHKVVVQIMQQIMSDPTILSAQKEAITGGISYANSLYDSILTAQSDDDVRAGLAHYAQIVNDLSSATKPKQPR